MTSEITSEPLAKAVLPPVVESAFDFAFATLFRERFPMLYSYLSRVSGDPALADDVAQESFVRLYARGSMPDDPSAWLISVANNIVRDEYRTTRRREKLLAGWFATEDQTQGSPASDTQVLAGEREATIRRALGALRVRDQRLLVLRHEGFSYREIAEALGIAPASVGTLLVRATAALAKVYREQTNASD